MLQASDDASTVGWFYADGQLKQEAVNLPSNISAQFVSHYLGAELREVTTQVMGQTDSTLSYSWTADGLLAQIQQTGSTVSTKSVKYIYDDAQRRTKVERFSDVNNANPVFQTVTVYASAAGTTVQNKGNKGRIETITHSRGSTDLAKYNNYSWDAAGRLTNVSSATTSHASHDNTSTFTYDSVNQLVGADYTNTNYVDLNFAYDDNGNRNTNGNVTGADNRQASDASWTYSYDANGNMIKKIRKSDNKEINYTYDHRNRLTDISDQTSTPTKKVHYGYDALNRRYLMTLDNNADGSIEKTEYYINQGLRTDRGNAGDELALQLDGNGVVQRRILHGALVDEVLAEEVVTSPTASETLWTLTDEQGSVRDIAKVVNGTATVVNHIMYDAFGNTAAETDVAISHLFGYTGREFDKGTGLQYNRERYYDPKSGRFISQDPMSFGAGDANLYRYVGNHGTYASDPSGLKDPDMQIANGSIISSAPMQDELDDYIASEQAKLAQRTDLRAKRLRDLGITQSEAHHYANVSDESVHFHHWLHTYETESLERLSDRKHRAHELDMLMLENVVKTVGGGFETAAGAGLVAVGAATSEIGVGIPIAATGSMVTAHGMDTTVSGCRGLAGCSQVDTLTSQGLQYIGFDREDANLIDFGIGFAGTIGASALRQEALLATRAVVEVNATSSGVLRSSSKLSSVERATPELLVAIRSKGRSITIVKEGSEEARYLDFIGAEANVGGETATHILLRPNPGKAAALEEFLHGTQHRLGITQRLGVNGAERHVKDFMIRHRKLLGLGDEDIEILRQLMEAGL